MDMIDKIIAFESGELEGKNIIELFSELIKNGQAWSLQGSYGRTAQGLIDKEIIDKEGIIDWDTYDLLVNGE